MKDTTDVLSKLDNIKSVPDNVFLVSLGVKSLYTSIPNVEEIKEVQESFNMVTKVVRTFLALISTLNYFVLNCKHYLHIKGFAMGTICGPSYANVFMEHFEKKYTLSFKEFH